MGSPEVQHAIIVHSGEYKAKIHTAYLLSLASIAHLFSTVCKLLDFRRIRSGRAA